MSSGLSPAQVHSEKRRRIKRVTNACDLCKRRKVKCDGQHPCEYCRRKDLAGTCTFTGPRARVVGGTRSRTSPARNNSTASVTPRARVPEGSETHASLTGPLSLSPILSRGDPHEDTEVPLEGRILRDAQGKVIFIGDCAPLSFLQTVRHLVAKVDSEGLPPQSSRDSIIEAELGAPQVCPIVDEQEKQRLVNEYFVATSGLVDMFDASYILRLFDETALSSSAVAVSSLVLAIGSQNIDKANAHAWFRKGLDILLGHMTNNMNVSTVSGFTLVAIFMLRAFQPNGAYLYFSLAARTAYAIGIHRAEVNASFGPLLRIRRDRIWRSLRVVDMLISCMLGRPPCTSDVDCTVKFALEAQPPVIAHIMDASLEIFMIIERVVVEVYSRKRISLRIADYVSRQFKNWASNWLQPLSEVIVGSSSDVRQESIVGACSTLCSYYYGIMLLTRPFLIYELYEHMGTNLKGGGSQTEHQRKSLYADAAMDAATSFVETLQQVIGQGVMPYRMPLIVSWLSTASLVLAISSLGRLGLSMGDTCRASISCLDYFGDADPHARQFAHTVRSIVRITTAFIEKRERQAVSQRRHASSELFGLMPTGSNSGRTQPDVVASIIHTEQPDSHLSEAEAPSVATSDWSIHDPNFFAVPWLSNEFDQGLQDFLQPGTHNLDGASIADIPLFPIFSQQCNNIDDEL